MKNNRSRMAFLLRVYAGIVMVGLMCLASCKKDDDQSPVPAITSINPVQGEIGAEVTIAGVNFSDQASGNAVTFSGVSATVKSASATKIVAVVPANAVTGPVKVAVNGQTATGPNFTVLTPVPLAIATITPSSGVVGSDVTITGTGFSATLAENIVKVNGVAATVKSATAVKLEVAIPANATTGPVTVEVKGKTVTGSVFTIVPTLTLSDMQPATGPKSTEVTLTGTGFSLTPSDNKVKFNGKDATVKSATATTLVVEVPIRAGTGKVSVVLGDQHVDGPDFQYQYTYTVQTIAGGTNGKADGTGTAAQFGGPWDVVVGKDGNIYVDELGNSRIRKVTPAGVVTTFAGSTPGYADSADPLSAQFGYIGGITQDNEGNFYISEPYFIRKIDLTGAVTTFAGSQATPYQSIDGTGPAASFYNPSFVDFGGTGELYVAEAGGNVIRKMTLDGVVTTIAGTAGAGSGGFQDGPAASAKFSSPYSAVADGRGNVYIADNLNYRIRKLSDGNVTTLAGSTAGFKDGPGDEAQFPGELDGMAVDQEGNIYVGDFVGNCVRMITPSGYVTTIAGKLSVAGAVDGVGADARFNGPRGLDIDADGNLYVADYNGNTLRKIIIE